MLTVHAAEVCDLVAFVWFRLGHPPARSLVLVGLSGPRQQAGPVLRVDLPTSRRRGGAVRDLAAFLHRHGQDGAFAVIACGRRDDDPCPDPGRDGSHRALVRCLLQELPRHGLEVVDVIEVGTRTFRSCLCRDSTCCPSGGFPLERVRTSRVATAMVLQGHVLHEDESALVRDVVPDREPSDGTASGGRDGPPDPPVPSDGTVPRGADDGRAPGNPLNCWRELLRGTGPVPTDLRWLGHELEDPLFRDALMLTLLPGSGDAAEALLAGRCDVLDPDLMSRAPGQELHERGGSLVAAWVRRAPEGHRAPGLAVLAWMAWWRGEGVRSRLLTERALRERPGYRLAALIRALLATGTSPERTDPVDGGPLTVPGAHGGPGPAPRGAGTCRSRGVAGEEEVV